MSHFRQLKLLCGVTTIHVNVHSGNFFNRSLSTIILPVLLPGKTILFEPFRSEPFICYGCYYFENVYFEVHRKLGICKVSKVNY